jgi:uncharacterized coiled-coil DUF342 family protein
LEEANTISSKKLARILRKNQLKEKRKRLADKLKNQEKLTSDEFSLIYDSIWQKGPKVKYQNPDKWIDAFE